MTCLAFRFTGCGGNSNNFPTRSKCYETCMPMDYFNCPANRPEVKQADGSIIICNDKTNCPEGSQCDYGAFFGICCDKKDHENLEADYHPDCGGRKSVKADSGETLLGKSCDHHFCPDGAECHHGHFFAYCCQ
ncbi:hypothetical protein Q1695_007998 [Nippostrongylus brasiliensis]|nr:hypothetical protein Q1695_007998 [Nippostrongylus brasiliensis]